MSEASQDERRAQPRDGKSAHEEWLRNHARELFGKIMRGDLREEEFVDLYVSKILKLESLAWEDGLTGLRNRRALDRDLPRLIELSRTLGFELSFVIIDIDHFKQLNDTYGHPAGDAVLIEMARLLKEESDMVDSVGHESNLDFVYRYGGEEMALILLKMPGSELSKVVSVLGKKVPKEVVKNSTVSGFGVNTLSVSIGATGLNDGDNAMTLLKRADGLLYSAKRQDNVEAPGRNRAFVQDATGGKVMVRF